MKKPGHTFDYERCPNCGTEGEVELGILACPKDTCRAYKLNKWSKWTKGYGGEQTHPVRGEK